MATGKWIITPFEERLIQLLGEESAKKGISQAQIVAKTGLPKSSLSRILNGKMQMDIGHLFQICDALGVLASDVVRTVEYQLGIVTTAPQMIDEYVLAASEAPYDPSRENIDQMPNYEDEDQTQGWDQ